MKLLRSAALTTSLTLAPLMSMAAPPPEAQVDYSADSTMETEGGMTMKSRIYRTPGKERMEMGGAGGSVTITRRDKHVRWQLMGNMYLESTLDESSSSDQEGLQIVEQTVVGDETINGVRTTKTKVKGIKKDGSKFGGFFWTTRQGITVKMEILSKEGDKTFRMASELTNLKIERQDPALFEVPAGYTKNEMGAMMSKSGMPNIRELMKQAEQEQSQDQQPSPEQRPSNTPEREESLDMGKMLKGLFGR